MKLYALTRIGCQVRGSEIRPFLQRVSDEHPHGSYTPDGIMYKFMSEEWVGWTIGDHEDDVRAVAASTTYNDMLGCRVARILFLVGDIGSAEGVRDIMRQFEKLCSDGGIGMIETVGRKGLSRVLTDFESEFVVCRKRLNNPYFPDYVIRPDAKPNTDEVGRA